MDCLLSGFDRLQDPRPGDPDKQEPHRRGRPVLADISLNGLERQRVSACFRRVHRAHIVNLHHVSASGSTTSGACLVRFA